MQQQFKNIILDLGGVIINLDYQRTASAFREMGAGDFETIYSQKKQMQLFDDFEKGILPESAFRNAIRSHLSKPVADPDIDAAWNAMLLDVPLHRLELLRSLKQQYRIFLLSNTNVIHVNSFSAMLEQTYGSNTFEKIFERIYYSCFLKMRKPDAAIFQLVLEENKLEKDATLFIDDSLQHVQGAMKAGITSQLLEKGMELKDLLHALKVI
jgi:FMN phosphatase YigB (HAD superfamily)